MQLSTRFGLQPTSHKTTIGEGEMASGIVIIKWVNGTADETIQRIITALYKDNEDVITGMNYLETEHDQVCVVCGQHLSGTN